LLDSLLQERKMGKVAVVSGASYGIGEHIAKQLANKGWEVALLARSLDKLRVVQHQIAQDNGVSLALQCDVTDRAAVKECMAKVEEAFGSVDVLVNNAAYVAPFHQFVDGDPAEWEKMVSVNVWGGLNLTRAVLPSMMKNQRGKIIFMSSRAGVSPTPGLAVHSGTKHMIEGVVGALRQEISGSGVSIGVVRPGGVATPGYDHATGVAQEGASLPTWIPSNSSSCLSASVVAENVVNMITMMDVADITDINIAANKQVK